MKYAIDAGTLTEIGDAIREKTGRQGTMTPPQMPGEIRGITGGFDNAIVEFNQMNAQLQAYLAAADAYTDTDRSTSVMPQYLSDTPYDDPVGQTVDIQENGTFYILDEGTGTGSKTTVSQGTATIYNLLPGHTYQGFVQNAAGQLVSTERLKATGAVRMLKFDYGPRNFRDLGGWACDGGTIQYGLFIRGGAFGDNPSDSDKKYAHDMGIKHEIDMRGSSETALTSSPIGQDVRYVCYAIPSYYKAIIDGSDPVSYSGVVNVLKTIMDAAVHGEACYFHCSLGADRTGTVSYLIEALLGVAKKDMDKDYELTTFYLYPAQAETRLRTSSTYNAMIDYLDSLTGSTFLDKVVWWYLKAGFGIDELNAFRAAAIDGTPEILVEPEGVYSITNLLTNATTSNSATSILHGTAYSAILTAADGYQLASVVVTMGGDDVTEAVYADGQITIPAVTGDVVVEATATQQAAFTNWLPLATDTDGSIYNGIGYGPGRLNSSGGVTSADGMQVTGFIPIAYGDVVRMQGIHFNRNSVNYGSHRICFYTADKAYMTLMQGDNSSINKITPVFNEQGDLIQFTVATFGSVDLTGTAYFRICGDTFDSAAIVTVNEEIT